MAQQPKIADRPLRAPRGTTLSCKAWPQEAALRLLMNSLDPELADHPEELLIYGAQKAARDWDALRAILAALPDLASGDSLFVQSGAIAAVQRTVPGALRLIIKIEKGPEPDGLPPERTPKEAPAGGAPEARGERALKDDLRELLRRSAASWCYAGGQAVLQPAYEILAAAGEQFGGSPPGDLSGKLVLAGSLDAFDSALSLAAIAHGASFLAIEADSERIKRALKAGYCDVMVNHLDEALRILKNNVRLREPVSVGLLGNCAEVVAELAGRGVVPDLILRGAFLRSPAGVAELEKLGAVSLDAARAPIEVYGEPLTCIALSGEPADIARVDRLLVELFSGNQPLQRFETVLARRIRFQGLPARVAWLPPAERVQLTVAVNDLVALGQVRAPMVFGRVFPMHPSQRKEVAIDSLLRAAEGITWVALEVSDRDPSMATMVSCAVLADGSAGVKSGIERGLGASA